MVGRGGRLAHGSMPSCLGRVLLTSFGWDGFGPSVEHSIAAAHDRFNILWQNKCKCQKSNKPCLLSTVCLLQYAKPFACSFLPHCLFSPEAGGRYLAYLADYDVNKILWLNMIYLSLKIKSIKADFENSVWLFKKSRWPPFLHIKGKCPLVYWRKTSISKFSMIDLALDNIFRL